MDIASKACPPFGFRYVQLAFGFVSIASAAFTFCATGFHAVARSAFVRVFPPK